MNQGVEILLSRMDSNPEEFTTARGKWDWIMDGINRRVAGKDKDVLAYLTDEEAQALYDKMQVLARDGFTRNVLATLLPEEEPLTSFKPGFGTGFDAAPIKAEGAPIQYERKIKLSRSQMELVRKLGETK